MSGSHSLTAFEPTEYEAIEATMSGSARGRWFLAEYARRNRSADTNVLLDAIARLESAVTDGHGPDAVSHFRGDIMEMASAISRTKAEIAAITDPDHDQTRLGIASEALDAIVQATERATTDILTAAEQVQESAWSLREHGIDEAACDALDRYATQIYTACSFQDLTAQRTSRIVQTLRYLEERLIAMMAIWGDAGAPVPPAPGYATSRPARESRPEDLDQSDVDRYLGMDAPAVIAAAHAALRAIEPGAVPLHDDIVFLPSAPEPEPEPESAAEASDVEAELDWADDFEAQIASEDDALEFRAADASPSDVSAETHPPAERALSFAEIDALSVEEKLALFC
ncbi:hypothetical protein FV232_18835 [Methylobacterium sp. WL30]|uniref:hypothetical protein n=1 Tax=unclassified Methylobacterium TaxID=2615210 RepID=UPI0011C8A784|nr:MULTISPECIES: hypothetical protein [unclassified Methylobacterium]TXN39691.1 hypothetical protein FV225_08845 [Methylobacterium sp. WL93]TXN50087.1 hypothetical protein FV227_13495 [Methylobacterium sp. WL119]TXN65219.1 hypothetical protein FV232_18835 [Methylobacterium sp. WL30]